MQTESGNGRNAKRTRVFCAALAPTNFFLFPDFDETWLVQGLRSLVLSQRAAMCAQVKFVISELTFRLNLT